MTDDGDDDARMQRAKDDEAGLTKTGKMVMTIGTIVVSTLILSAVVGHTAYNESVRDGKIEANAIRKRCAIEANRPRYPDCWINQD